MKRKKPKTKLALCALLGASAATAFAAPTGYWPLNDGSGTTAINSAGGTNGTLNGAGTTWVTDAERGTVVQFDGTAGAYVGAGTINATAAADYTWSFWSKADAGQAVNNDVIVGNRKPDGGWSKFTPNQFEYRDLAATYNVGINYADFTAGVWQQSTLVKRGQLMTYYRNGLAMGNVVTSATLGLPAGTPLYFGGDGAAGENWQGRLSDVAVWESALPMSSVIGIAKGAYNPASAPMSAAGPTLTTVFADNFSGGLGNWTAVDKGLEQVGAAGYNIPSAAGGQATLGGTTTAQYWYGSSIQSVSSFSSTLESEVSVDRVSLTGTGTAYRSSLWIYGDDTHYLHFSQNIGEAGWSYNARDDGGLGTSAPTGGGNNLVLADGLDGDGGMQEMSVHLVPTGTAGEVNMEIMLNGQLQAVQGFSNFPSTFTVMLTGQGRAIGDNVAAVFDNLVVQQVPEPAAGMLALGALAVTATRRRRA